METIWNFLSVIVPFLGLLTVVVFIHEMGHFLVARWCGVKVKAFSIGFGPEIAGFNDRYGTRWRFASIPLGGYVKFVDDENAASAPSREALEALPAEERRGALQEQPLLNRTLIVAAGPAFNIVSAIIIYALTFWAFGTYGTAAVVDEVLKDGAASRAGLQSGDRIVEIEGNTISRFADLQRLVSQRPGDPLSFVVDRNGNLRELSITPELKEIEDPLGNKIKVGVIGIKRNTAGGGWEHKQHSLPQSVGMAFNETGYVSWQIVSSLPKIPYAIFKTLTGQRQAEIGGPIAIAEMTAHATKGGVSGMLLWLAVFSIMLGIMNLLPIPVLDGGHLLFYAIEGIRGRPMDERNQELSFRIGLAILATMMFAAIIGDIMRKLGIG